MGKREAYVEKFDAQAREWAANVDELKAKADKAKAEAKIEYHELMEKLLARHLAAQTKLQVFQQSGEDAWEDLKPGLERAWIELKAAMEQARAKFT